VAIRLEGAEGLGDPASLGDVDALEWRFRTTEGPLVDKCLRIGRGGVVDIEWTWSPDDFELSSLFAPELSLGATVELQFDGDPDVWRYPIVTTSKCPDGFEEITQGESVTPRWPIERGRASLRIAPA
jgi:hypothetical protein